MDFSRTTQIEINVLENLQSLPKAIEIQKISRQKYLQILYVKTKKNLIKYDTIMHIVLVEIY